MTPAFLFHVDDDLAFGTAPFNEIQSILGRFERKDPLHNWPDHALIDEGGDFAQLSAVRPHEEERVRPLTTSSGQRVDRLNPSAGERNSAPCSVSSTS